MSSFERPVTSTLLQWQRDWQTAVVSQLAIEKSRLPHLPRSPRKTHSRQVPVQARAMFSLRCLLPLMWMRNSSQPR